MHLVLAVVRMLVLMAGLWGCVGAGWAQQPAATATPPAVMPSASETSAPSVAPLGNGVDPQPATAKENAKESLMTGREFLLSVLIVIFGIFISLIQYLLLRSIVKEKTEIITRTFTITLIVVGTMFLIAAGYRTEQISPALGLFGTIAGYLLGRTDQAAARQAAHPAE